MKLIDWASGEAFVDCDLDPKNDSLLPDFHVWFKSNASCQSGRRTVGNTRGPNTNWVPSGKANAPREGVL